RKGGLAAAAAAATGGAAAASQAAAPSVPAGPPAAEAKARAGQGPGSGAATVELILSALTPLGVPQEPMEDVKEQIRRCEDVARFLQEQRDFWMEQAAWWHHFRGTADYSSRGHVIV
ncbi:unnamed protein product, partial [Prorocentrum cordatum]